VSFCAHTTGAGHIGRLEKGKLDNYAEEIRSNLDLLLKRHRAGFLVFDNVYEVEDNLEEAYAISDDTIDSIVDLYMAMLAQGVPYDLQWRDEEFEVFDDTGTKQSIASIILFLQNQKAVAAFYSRIIDECNGASQGNESKGQFYLNEVLFGTNTLAESLEDAIKNMNTESLSLTYNDHCGAII
jgi:hypothetical protein